MGHQHQPAESSGVLVAVIVAIPVVAILALIVLGGFGMFLYRSAAYQHRVANEMHAVVQMQHADALAQPPVAVPTSTFRVVRPVQTKVSGYAPTVIELASFTVQLDRAGNARIDDQQISLAEVKKRLQELQRANGHVSVVVQTHPETLAKHVLAIQSICDDLGDVEFRLGMAKEAVAR